MVIILRMLNIDLVFLKDGRSLSETLYVTSLLLPLLERRDAVRTGSVHASAVTAQRLKISPILRLALGRFIVCLRLAFIGLALPFTLVP